MKHLITTLMIILSGMPALVSRDIYVAKNGNDENPGTFEEPYLTLAMACRKTMAGDVVYIREGVYEEILQPVRSGTASNPITFMPYNNERVVISAMEGWELDEGSVYKTYVGWDMGHRNFVLNREEACDLARWPNNNDGDPFTLNSLTNTGGSDGDVITDAYLDYSSGIPDHDWSNGGSLFFYCDAGGAGWTAWKAYIKSNTSTRLVFDLNKNPTWIRTVHPPSKRGDFYLEGIREVLDYDNEWYFDAGTKTLYLQIPGGGKPEDGQISMRKRILCIDINARTNIIIKNLTTLGGGINIGNADNLLYGVYSYYGSMTRGVVTGFSSGENAVLLKGTNNTLEKCEIAYGSGNGIKIEGSGNRVINCSIHDFNYLGCYDAPVNMRGGSSTHLMQNDIYRGGRDCVQMFNYGSEIAYNNIFRSNLIADDCGLLYTVGGPFATKIHHNWLHHTQSRGGLYKAAGIYLDNDANGFLVHHNVVWETEWSNIQINLSAKNIDIFNNTLWDGSAAMGAWHREGTSFSNVRVWNNMADNSNFEPQSDKQNNLTETGDPFVDWDGRNFQLKQDAAAVDYGRVISGITGIHYGEAPDAGAYEHGGLDLKAGITWDPGLGPDYCLHPDTYLEDDAYLVIEAESAAETGGGWKYNYDEAMALGELCLEYSGAEHDLSPVDSTSCLYLGSFNSKGSYRPSFRVKGSGSIWVKTGSGDYQKLESDSPDKWIWIDAEALIMDVDTGGIYGIRMAGGAPGIKVDRIALAIDERNGISRNDSIPESDSWCGEQTPRIHWAASVTTDVTLTDQGFVIDGLMEEEWEYSDTLRTSLSPDGTETPAREDLGMLFRLAYDSNNLYILAEVEDDHLAGYSGNDGDYHNWDNVELHFNPDKMHNPLGIYGEDARQIRLNFGVAGSPVSGNGSWEEGAVPEGFAYISMETEKGYVIEASIPWEGILPEGMSLEAGMRMGFEIQVNDSDEEPGIVHRLAWANDTEFDLAAVDTRKFGHLILNEAEYKYVNKNGWEVIHVDSEESPGARDLAIDGNSLTHWSTVWRGTQDPLPHEIWIDFHEQLDIKDIHLLPRQDNFGPNGSIGEYEIYVSDSTGYWGAPRAGGSLDWGGNLAANNRQLQIIPLDKVRR